MTLVFKELVCGYGDTVVVRGVSGEVQPGHALAIVGRNGVGKSTLMKALAGQLPLTSGDIDWDGQALGERALHARLGLGIAFALLMGLAGGVPPAIRAARLPLTAALRDL